MKLIKSIISLFIVLISIFLVIGGVYADYVVNPPNEYIPGFGGVLSASLNETTLHVGDTVALTIHPQNYRDSDWENILIYAPIPEGFKYLSHVVPNRTMQDYNPSTGIWNVQQMLHGGRGADKELIITLKVLPEAVGTHTIFLKHTIKFKSLISVYPTGEDCNPDYYDVVASNQAPGNPRPITVTVLPASKDKGHGNSNGNGTGNGTGNGKGSGSGNGTGNGTDNGNNPINNLGNSKLTSDLANLTQSEKDNPLANLQAGGGGSGENKKANEVTVTTPAAQDNTLGMYIMAALLIMGLLAVGYFYGIKREE